MMLKRLSILVAASLLSANAMASDNWTGWYVGANTGYSRGSSDVDTTLSGQWTAESAALQSYVANEMSPSLDPDGVQFGVQVGYNHSFNGFLLGGELSYNRMNMDDTRQTGPTPTTPFPTLTYDVHNKVEVDDELALRLKLGYASNRHAIYGTVGIARVDATVSAGIVSNGLYNKHNSEADNLHGVQYGAGYEFDFGNNWSLRAEILRTDLEDTDFVTEYQPGSTFVTPAYTESVNQDLDYTTFRVGVNYRF
jgi:outer membrane immunogenic protein